MSAETETLSVEHVPLPGRAASIARPHSFLLLPLTAALGAGVAALTTGWRPAAPSRAPEALAAPLARVASPSQALPAPRGAPGRGGRADGTIAVGQDGNLDASAAALDGGAALSFLKGPESQLWRWPAHLDARRATAAWELGGLRGPSTGPRRRLAGWHPGNPAGRTLQFLVADSRGGERLVFEEELAAFEREAEAARRAAPPPAEDLGAVVGHYSYEAPKAAAPAPAPAAVRAAVPAAAPFDPLALIQNAKKELDRSLELRLGAMEHFADAQRALHLDKKATELTLEETQRIELEATRRAAGAVSVRDVRVAGGPPTAELTYADGRREIVPYDPLVLDLSGRGVQTSPRKVLFDLAGERRDDKIQWINDLEDGTGILVFDPAHDGSAGSSGASVFGDRTDLENKGAPTGFLNGFAALRALAEKAAAEGVISRKALDWGTLGAGELEALHKKYGLAIKLGGFGGRVVSLKEAGVQALALSQSEPKRVADYDGRGNDVLMQQGAVFLRKDGTTGYYMNLWLTAKKG